MAAAVENIVVSIFPGYENASFKRAGETGGGEEKGNYVCERLSGFSKLYEKLCKLAPLRMVSYFAHLTLFRGLLRLPFSLDTTAAAAPPRLL